MKKYIYTFIIVFVGYFILNSIYLEMNKDKTPGKAKRLECQRKVVSFERGFGNDDISFAQEQIISGNNSFTSFIEKAVYSKSKLFNYISLNITDKVMIKELESYIKKENIKSDEYTFSYYIYENDKKDPGKKTNKSKLYAGYIVFEVKNKNKKTIYKAQIDFMDSKGADIANTIRCTVKSFMTYNKTKD